jgi:group I intron endonuclease
MITELELNKNIEEKPLLNKGVIYKVTCLINNKIYIGKTNFFNKRRYNHIKDSKNPKTYFHKALSKYGPENFIWEIIEEDDIKKLSEREQYWIKKFDSFGNGYNLTFGGEGFFGMTRSEETKAKISKANKGENSAWYNKKHTPEQIDKIRNSIKKWWITTPKEIIDLRNKNLGNSKRNKPLSEDHKKKISEANKGNIVFILPEQIIKTRKTWKEKYKNGFINPMKGKNHSEGTKEKMRIKAKNRIMFRDLNGRFISTLK